MERHETLKMRDAYAYGVGEFGFTFFLLFISYYLMFFMTDVLRMESGTVAVVYSALQWMETITSFVAGWLLDRWLASRRRYSFWTVVGSVACAAAFWAFFTVAPFPQPWMRSCYFVVMYVISYFAYNLMWIAYRSLMGLIARTHQDVLSLNLASCQCSYLSSFLFSFVAARLLTSLGNGQTAFSLCALLYGTVLIVSMAIVSFWSGKREQAPLLQNTKTRVSVKDIRCSLNGPMMPFFVSIALRSSAVSLMSALVVYHFKYVFHAEDAVSAYLLVISVSQLAGVSLIRFIGRRISNKTLYILSAAVQAVALMGTFLVRDSYILFLSGVAVSYFFCAFGTSLMPSYLSDIADYNCYCKGLQTRGIVLSAGKAATAVASVIGGSLASYSLKWIGYSADAASISGGMVQSISVVMILGSALLVLASIVPMLWYPLNKSMIDVIYKKKLLSSEQGSAV